MRFLTIEKVKNYVESVDGYKLISTKYDNSKTKLTLQCPKGHIFQMRYNDFQQGQRCPKCSCKCKFTYEYVKECIESRGYTLLSHEYTKNTDKLHVRCDKGHLVDIKFSTFKVGQRCRICAGNQRHSYEYVKEYIEKEGYILISTRYINALKKIKIKCPRGHIFQMSFNGFKYGYRCVKCAIEDGGSTPEKEILSYIKEHYNGVIIPNDRETIYNYWTKKWLELDIYLPELKKAIEYNGEYYHKSDNAKWLDMIKKKRCRQLGIDLLIINDNEWMINKDFSIIDNFIKRSND
jgi:hypothetical protein